MDNTFPNGGFPPIIVCNKTETNIFNKIEKNDVNSKRLIPTKLNQQVTIQTIFQKKKPIPIVSNKEELVEAE